MKLPGSEHGRFSRKDVAEIALGCCAMAFPIATTEEIWKLGETLSLGRVLLVAAGSVVVLSLLIYELHYQAHRPNDRRDFVHRVLSMYGLTLAVSALLLVCVDRLDLFAQPLVAIKRTILVAFPASVAATVVDCLG